MARRVLALLLLHLLFISVTHCKQQVMQKAMQKVDITQVMPKVIISSSSKIFKPKKEEIRYRRSC